MRSIPPAFVAAALLLPAVAAPARAGDAGFEQDVGRAIDRGVDWLKKDQRGALAVTTGK